MSENNTNKSTKIYVPGTFVKEHKFSDGGSVIRFSINLEKFAPFVKANKKENGYINFNINARKEVGAFGDTHSVSLDQWEPTKGKASTTSKKIESKPKQPVAKKVESPAPEESQEEFV